MMFALKRLTLLLLLLLNSTALARGGLNIEITQGIDATLPIAVVNFKQQENDNALLELATVIRADLANSGYFNSLAPERFQQQPHKGEQVNFGYWRRLGAEHVVVGKVLPRPGERFDIEFELLSIYPNKSRAQGKQFSSVENQQLSSHTLISAKFSDIQKRHLRSLAHHISDLVFYELTGVRGAFQTRIAYVVVERQVGAEQRYYLKVADADGYNEQILVSSPQPLMSPSWSPDGKKLAFVSFENNRSEVYVIELATGSRTLVSKYKGINGAPAFSPNGDKLALVLSKSGKPKVYTLDLNSKHLQQVTFGNSIDTEPSWAPDGRSLVFTSNRGGSPQIYNVDLASQQVKRLTFDGTYNARASYTPDGKKLVIINRNEQKEFHVSVLDLRNHQMQRLSKAHLDESPSVAPNGAMVLYGTQAQGVGVLGAVSIDGRVHLRLPVSGFGDVQEPAWSPFLSG